MMQWQRLKLDRAEWIIPAAIMKMRRDRKVPLSRQALAIIRAVEPICRGSEFVFPTFYSMRIPISENTINRALVRLGFKGTMTAHGFHSTASTLLNESKLWDPDVIELALTLKDPNSVRSIYNRAIYWEQRVKMMQWWSDRLDELKAFSSQAGFIESRPLSEPQLGSPRFRVNGHERCRTKSAKNSIMLDG